MPFKIETRITENRTNGRLTCVVKSPLQTISPGGVLLGKVVSGSSLLNDPGAALMLESLAELPSVVEVSGFASDWPGNGRSGEPKRAACEVASQTSKQRHFSGSSFTV